MRGVAEKTRGGPTLEYYDPLGDVLMPGERKVWVGRPTRRLFLRGNDATIVPLAAAWTLAWTWWLLGSLGWHQRGAAPVDALFHAMAVLVGVGLLGNRFFVPWQQRGRQWYAITDRRCLWVSDGRPHELRELMPADVQGVMFERHGDGSGTIAIALRYPLAARFEHVEDPAAVHDLIRAWLHTHPRASAGPGARSRGAYNVAFMAGALSDDADSGAGGGRSGAERCAYVLAAILLGQAIWFGVPGFSATALGLVVAAIGVTAAGLVWRAASPRIDALAGRTATALVMLGVVAGFARLPFRAINPGYPAGDVTFFGLAGVAALLAAGVFVARRRRHVAACFWVLVVVHLAMGAWYLTLGNRQAVTDVHLVQHLGCQALLRGENPFAMTFPDIYGPAARIYPPGMVIDGRVQSGFSYPPLAPADGAAGIRAR